MACTLAAALFALGAAGAAPPDEPGPIQDNSFLIEEAYNQEPGVVQHISAFTRDDEGAWAYAFTQEWPAPRQAHQLSVTLVWLETADPERGASGLSDAALNYRWQAAGDGQSRLALAPRLSVLVPTGDEERGLGSGHAGLQVNLPLSLRLSPGLVAHSNAGATWVPSTRSPAGERADTRAYQLGQSLVWLARPRFNVMIEGLYLRAEEVIGEAATDWRSTFLLSPGIRGAIDLDSGLQIVPGIAVPLGAGPSGGYAAILFYLSFEHPFRTGAPPPE
jgi:hypothetical protein